MTTLREMREQRGMSLLDVERAIALHRGTLSKIERGLEAPTPEQLAELSRLYGVATGLWRTVLMHVHPGEA